MPHSDQEVEEEDLLEYVPRDKRPRVDLVSLRSEVMRRAIIAEREEKFALAGLSVADLERMDPRYELAARQRAIEAAKSSQRRQREEAFRGVERRERESELVGYRPGAAPTGTLYRRIVHEDGGDTLENESRGEGGGATHSRSPSRDEPPLKNNAHERQTAPKATEQSSQQPPLGALRPEPFAPRKQGNHAGAPTTAEIKRFNRTLFNNAVMEVHPTSHARVEGRRVLPPPGSGNRR